MPEPLWILIKLILAVIFGGAVGWQREARDRPAGLRTHVLVCVGSAVYTLASLSFHGPGTDPGRVAAQVATGMGFLGAGTIIRHGNIVRGLTTAASLWAIAAVGICVGIGGHLLWAAALATVITLLTLTLLRRAERRLLARAHPARVTLRFPAGPNRIQEAQDFLASQGVSVESVELAAIGPDGEQELRLRVELPAGFDLSVLANRLSQIEGLLSVRCE
jgi:putative Mg2+ transporter-C (MgtC) family protein